MRQGQSAAFLTPQEILLGEPQGGQSTELSGRSSLSAGRAALRCVQAGHRQSPQETSVAGCGAPLRDGAPHGLRWAQCPPPAASL